MIFLKLFLESFRFAFTALRENKTRTFLSLLGVTIGIMTIIGIFSAVNTLRANLESSVEKLGSRSIYIQKWPWGGGGEYPWWRYVNRPEPTIHDFDQLQQRMTLADGIALDVGIQEKTLKYLNNNVENVYVDAVTHDFYKIRNLEFEAGRYFTDSESERGSPVVILGAVVARGLFPNADPIGKTIQFLGRRFTVIGVFKEEGEGMLIDVSLDNIAVIPLNFARNVINVRNFGPSIIVNAKDGIPLDEVESEIRGLMRSIHRLSPREEDDFALNQTTIITAQLDTMFKMVNTAGFCIGILSVLVGGFGIANIMFVSVKERTHIIGIQKSLGAKNYFILSQFLIESVALCIIGGLMGLSVVYGLAFLLKVFAGIGVVVHLDEVVLAIFISTTIGLISGIIPAVIASKLDPVEAIRSK
ncbi:ABC transporter permease [Olivibacter sp. SDN3]|uniref:ABC transporter permease n=1 Tax=Olivibacter sp. SDN3 TaxID=2764720 RepID=UPI0016513158|nr:ABC transporter permease [Olivibacter sp. SDN3]QNL49507.1 ABC transporter permease [Olivibacter sp. SDN3]